MINVDVYVPALDRTYNFNLDGEARISHLIGEISELICKKEQSVLDGAVEQLVMGSIERKINFNAKQSLQDYSVNNGDTLILV